MTVHTLQKALSHSAGPHQAAELNPIVPLLARPETSTLPSPTRRHTTASPAAPLHDTDPVMVKPNAWGVSSFVLVLALLARQGRGACASLVG